MMRNRWSWVLVSLLAASASAQEFELDLSDDSSAPTSPRELRPTLAVLEVGASDGDEVSTSRAKQLETELLSLLAKAEQFQAVLPPAPTAEHCADVDCFKRACATAKAQRGARVTVQRQGVGSLVTVLGFDPAEPQLIRVTIESGEKAEKTFMGVAGKTQAQRDREFLRKVLPQLRSAFKKLAVANGKVVVDNRDPGTPVLVDGEQVGLGRVEAVVSRGPHTVSLGGTTYEPYSQSVTVKPLETVSVELKLVAKPLTQVVTKKSTSVPVFARPGLYLAIAGAAAAAVGVALGVSTQGVQQRIDAGGRPVAVTRTEAMNAATNAVLANVLVGGGAALVAGGITWVALTPSRDVAPVGEPTDHAGPPTWTLSLGGTF